MESAHQPSLSPKEANDIMQSAATDLEHMVRSDDFKTTTDDIADRLKTIATINVIGKVILITAGSMLFAGVASAAVGATLETAGASTLVVGGGELFTEALAFTAASRLGQGIAFGQVEGSFIGDFASNLAMIGAFKGATKLFTKVFKAFANPEIYKVSYAFGKAGVGLATVQMFSEAQYALLNGKLMSGEERYRSVLQNLILFGSMEAAGFITKPIHERFGAAVAKAFGLDKRFSGELLELQKQQAELRTTFDSLKRSGTPDPAEISKLLKGMSELWAKELSLLKRGSERHAITAEQYEEALKTYDAAGARLELQLANLGIEIPQGSSRPTFQRVGEGVVSFAPKSESVVEQFYAEKKGTFKERQKGGFEGRLPTGEVTIYYPEAEVPKSVASDEAITKARDAAQRAADGDPRAQDGLDSLQKKMGARKADAVLANAKDVDSFLRALADPGFKRRDSTFYEKLAGEPAAVDFARKYGGELLRNLVERFGWEQLPDAMARASAALEGAPDAEARQKLTGDLAKAKNAAKIDSLLGKPAPPKAPRPRGATKQSMLVDRSAPSWDVYRVEARNFAEKHKESLTEEQLDIRADLEQVLAAARLKKFSRLGHAAREAMLDRFDELAIESGMTGTKRVWVNRARGALSESLFNPQAGNRKPIFFKGVEMPSTRRISDTAGAADIDREEEEDKYTIPDYQIPRNGFTEWVEQKSDEINKGNPETKTGAFRSGVAAAGKYLQDAKTDIKNLPPGDKLSIDFVRDPGPVTVQRMLDILFAPGSPFFRVRFGEGTWHENPNP
jgi:hypothetical protein